MTLQPCTAAATASTGAPPYSADADLLCQTAAKLRDQLTDA